MYHVQLRQFPHNFCHFNLAERELRETILGAWAQGEWIELGERKWNPHQASLIVLEGPQLPVEQLSMGRGWRNATRQGKDVTERLLAAEQAAPGASGVTQARTVGAGGVEVAEQPPTGGEGPPPVGSTLDMRLVADSLGLEALAMLGDGPVPIANVWQLARERYPEHPTSDCLKLAEYAILSLAEAKLAVVLLASGGEEAEPCPPEQVKQAFQAIDSWSRAEGSASMLIRRA